MNIIDIKDISKKFIIAHEKDALIRNILPAAFRLKYKEEFWALKNITLKVEQGESLGIVGPNGAGKSTLLNIVSGISSPTLGDINVKGKISTVLSLGAGFHPELTGEENIFLNGSILGMSVKEVKDKVKDIVRFSELGSFIDAPIQTYSAGMLLRLGFSIAVHVDFDVLLIDEIISVGDIYFQKKCIDKIKEFKKSKKTLIVSSQSLDLINSLTDRAVLLSKGKLIESGKTEFITKSYGELSKKDPYKEAYSKMKDMIEHRKTIERLDRIIFSWEKKEGSKEAEILDVVMTDLKDQKKTCFRSLQPLKIKVRFRCNKEISNPHFGIAFFKKDRTYCYGPNTKFDEIKIEKLNKGEGEFCLVYPEIILSSDDYFVSVAIWDDSEKLPHDYHCCCYRLKISGKEGDFLYRENYLTRIEHKGNEDRSIELKNRFGEAKEIFHTGQALNVEMPLKGDTFRQKAQAVVFREDGIACFKLEKMITGKKKRRCIFEIDRLHLLPGRYFVTGNDNGYKRYFNVYSEKEDHGIVYMPHEWDLRLP